MATVKQRRAVKEITENHMSVSAAMRKVGYDLDTASKPSNLTASKGFRELMDSMGIDDDRLLNVLNEGLDATKTVVMGQESKESFVDVQPDFSVRHRYLETGLRLKGLGKEPPQFNTLVIPILSGASNVHKNDGNRQTTDTNQKD